MGRAPDEAKPSGATTGDAPSDDSAVVDRVISRYLRNKKLIEAVSQAYKVEPLFFWQPVPTYELEKTRHPFAPDDYDKHAYSARGYERMAAHLEAHPLGRNFIWGADLHKNTEGPLYVDAVHYSANFSQKIARTIGDILMKEYPLPARAAP